MWLFGVSFLADLHWNLSIQYNPEQLYDEPFYPIVCYIAVEYFFADDCQAVHLQHWPDRSSKLYRVYPVMYLSQAT